MGLLCVFVEKFFLCRGVYGDIFHWFTNPVQEFACQSHGILTEWFPKLAGLIGNCSAILAHGNESCSTWLSAAGQRIGFVTGIPGIVYTTLVYLTGYAIFFVAAFLGLCFELVRMVVAMVVVMVVKLVSLLS